MTPRHRRGDLEEGGAKVQMDFLFFTRSKDGDSKPTLTGRSPGFTRQRVGQRCKHRHEQRRC